ncbi:hypothetical protein [Arcobacter cloacae]|uniref:Uncharacterized protein n=1 Tax=Arcobacter cloacae TaxID=1054034 RepID=A0A6M8NEV0_9BACT|nr:hypothetical protein [Arcobacter cloacae]QKF88789.1 hypothetical protein ACLO_0259 [Arcobacter cloacae]RXI37140.1 hypothetical protein CP963_13625 [Arcobacter cloacae]
MKKVLLICSFIIITILIMIYALLFTSFGNKIISSYIEKVINHEQEELYFKVENFNLTTKKLDFKAYVNDGSELKISGNISIWKRDFDLKYSINILDLTIIKNLNNLESKGSLCTNGIFKGNYKNANIEGISNIAKSQTKYYLNLKKFEIASLNLEVKEAKINELLMIMGNPSYLKGKLNIFADIKNFNSSNLEGIIKSNIVKGKVDNDVINQELELGIGNLINFEFDFNASIVANNMEIKTILDTSVGDILIDRMIVDLSTKKINSDYKINISNMAVLSGFVDKKLAGSFITTGIIESLDNKIKVDGISDIFESETKYKAIFDNFKLSSISFSIEKAKIENLLKMISEPIYATGDLNIVGNIKNADLNNLDGFVNSNFNNIAVVNEVTNTVFNQNIKDDITANLVINSKLVPNQVVSQIALETNVGNLSTTNSTYFIKEDIFSSEYLFNIPSLEKMDNFIGIKLLGKMDLLGKITIDENKFLLDGKSNFFNGLFDFRLENENLMINLTHINAKSLLLTLEYPQILDSSDGNLTINYNLDSKKGELVGSFINGQFLSNSFTSFLNPIIKTDLEKDVYKTININSKIKDEFLISNIIFKNENKDFEIKDLIIDYETKSIDIENLKK